MSEHWKFPEGGKHGVAIRSDAYEARTNEIDNFLGRPLAKYSHYFQFEGQTYAVFSFREKADADKFMAAFEGEPFDARDAGSGSNWMKWYKGRYAKRKRSPYDFRNDND